MNSDRISKWQSGRSYIQRDGEMIEVSGGHPKFYDPTIEDELPERLIEVANGLTLPEEFGKEYGRLGRLDTTVPLGFENVGEEDLLPEDFMRKVVLKRQEKDYPQVFPWEGGEQIAYILAHARTVRAANKLIAHSKGEDAHKLRTALQELPKTQYASLTKLSEYGDFDWVFEYAKHDLRATAHAALIALVNPNLRGVQHELRRDEFGNLRYALTYQTLIQVVYWHLARRVENKKILSSYCKRCGEPFFHTDPRQKYCPRPLGKSRSECGRIAVKEAFIGRWPDGKSHRPRREKRSPINLGRKS